MVRESPRATQSPDKNSAQWPPKSPFQALLSSPSGRRKWQDQRERDVSPSPVKRSAGSEKAVETMSVASEEEEGDEEEDEEMLRLKLQAIQAKLKLKKLQKAKKEDGGRDDSARATSRAQSVQRSRMRASKVSATRPRSREKDVEVPLSPTKDRQPLKEHPSPARKRLGLSTVPKAQDVSLKRAREGTQLKRGDSLRRAENEAAAAKPLSFSERLNRSRAETEDQKAKQDWIEKVRAKGFNSNQALPSAGFQNPRTTPASNRPSSAHQVHTSTKLDCEAGIARSASTRSSRPERPSVPRANGLFTSRAEQPTNGIDIQASSDDPDAPKPTTDDQDQTSPGYDSYSQIHLSKRQIPHVDVARAMDDKEVYTLPRLLKEVKAPHYDPPDCESDFVVLAVLASKSSPFDQKATHRTSDENKAQEDAEAPRNKFMVLNLCDLKWEVDCFLFGTAFDQFWKLTPGTLLAILNPSILPPKTNQHSGRFSLKLGSSEDCVMEIGAARDIGYCNAMKKDGQSCGAWIDKRKTEICEFHLNLEIDRNRKHRMEVNSMWRGSTDTEGRGGNKSRSRQQGGFDRDMKKDKKQGNYHREYGRLYSVAGGGGGKSAASLLDAEDMDALHNMSQEEASRKRIAEAQKERDLAKRLGEMGNGMGAEYLRVKTSNTTSTMTSVRSSTASSGRDTGTPYFEKPSISELGLLGKKAEDQHLSPAKDRKRHFGLGAISSSGPDAMGWGGARKPGLLQPKEKPASPEKGQTKMDGPRRPGIVRGRSEEGSLSPKKRARFMLEKGIREPGRESLGEELLKAGSKDSDDDELDIV